MLSFTTAYYHWANKVIQTVLRGVLETFVERFLHATSDAPEGGMGTTKVCEPVS